MADSKRKNYVETPRGKIVDVHHKDGTVTMELKWNPGFSTRMNKSFSDVQGFVDSECIRLMTPYTPMQNGILYKSATLGTTIGSGMIHQVAPYARYQYYGKLMVSSVTGSSYARNGESKVLTNKDLKYSTAKHPQAQKLWFEVMKAEKKQQILRGAAAITRRRK